MKITNVKQTAKHFDEKWWKNRLITSRYKNIIRDLLSKITNPNKQVQTQASQLNRGLITCEYILKNYKKKSKILEMACGIGFVTHALIKKGFDVKSFDISKEAINSAKNIAENLNQDPERFVISDERYLKKIKSNSLDVIIGLGYFRYINFKKQEKVYRECKRILKKNGTLIIDHQNELYEMFALNNESINYWSDFIENYCNLNKIFKKGDLLKKMNSFIKVPIRKRENHSISSKSEVFRENPIIYKEKAVKNGFYLIDIKYPHTDILPPFLHKKNNLKFLYQIQKDNCYKLSNHWKSMFMCYQFLSFLKPKK